MAMDCGNLVAVLRRDACAYNCMHMALTSTAEVSDAAAASDAAASDAAAPCAFRDVISGALRVEIGAALDFDWLDAVAAAAARCRRAGDARHVEWGELGAWDGALWAPAAAIVRAYHATLPAWCVSLDVVRAFVVSYDARDECSSHAPHVDPRSDVTFNAPLAVDAAYAGGALVLHGGAGRAAAMLKQSRGTVLVHGGAATHSATGLSYGARSNLILWTRRRSSFPRWRRVPAAVARRVAFFLGWPSLLSLAAAARAERRLAAAPFSPLVDARALLAAARSALAPGSSEVGISEDTGATVAAALRAATRGFSGDARADALTALYRAVSAALGPERDHADADVAAARRVAREARVRNAVARAVRAHLAAPARAWQPSAVRVADPAVAALGECGVF